MAKLIKTDGTIETVEPKNGTDFKLEELQGFVGGYIEIFQLYNGNIMVLSEEGKLIGLERNAVAELLAELAIQCPLNDTFVGNVLLCKEEEVK